MQPRQGLQRVTKPASAPDRAEILRRRDLAIRITSWIVVCVSLVFWILYKSESEWSEWVLTTIVVWLLLPGILIAELIYGGPHGDWTLWRLFAVTMLIDGTLWYLAIRLVLRIRAARSRRRAAA